MSAKRRRNQRELKRQASCKPTTVQRSHTAAAPLDAKTAHKRFRAQGHPWPKQSNNVLGPRSRHSSQGGRRGDEPNGRSSRAVHVARITWGLRVIASKARHCAAGASNAALAASQSAPLGASFGAQRRAVDKKKRTVSVARSVPGGQSHPQLPEVRRRDADRLAGWGRGAVALQHQSHEAAEIAGLLALKGKHRKHQRSVTRGMAASKVRAATARTGRTGCEARSVERIPSIEPRRHDGQPLIEGSRLRPKGWFTRLAAIR